MGDNAEYGIDWVIIESNKPASQAGSRISSIMLQAVKFANISANPTTFLYLYWTIYIVFVGFEYLVPSATPFFL